MTQIERSFPEADSELAKFQKMSPSSSGHPAETTIENISMCWYLDGLVVLKSLLGARSRAVCHRRFLPIVLIHGHVANRVGAVNSLCISGVFVRKAGRSLFFINHGTWWGRNGPHGWWSSELEPQRQFNHEVPQWLSGAVSSGFFWQGADELRLDRNRRRRPRCNGARPPPCALSIERPSAFSRIANRSTTRLQHVVATFSTSRIPV